MVAGFMGEGLGKMLVVAPRPFLFALLAQDARDAGGGLEVGSVLVDQVR